MLKKNVKKQLCVLMVLIVTLCSMTIPAAAAETSDTIVFSDVAIERTSAEADNLLEIYNELFPDEYKYIIEYKDYGVKDIGDEEIAVSVYRTAKKDGIEYTLTVMNNGQIFMNYIKDKVVGVSLYGAAYGTRHVQDFVVGDFGKYMTFTTEYVIYDTDFDVILSCTEKGDGFIITPLHKETKLTEDASGPAYYKFCNVKMSGNVNDVMYDIGVAVGKNKAKGLMTGSSLTAKAWVWSFIYAFTEW